MLVGFDFGGRFFNPSEEAKALEVELGLQAGFVLRLVESSDFDFALKCSSLMEASLSLVLKSRLTTRGIDLKDPKAAIDAFVEALPLVGRASKMSLATDLALVAENEKQAIAFVFETRNKYAHDVRAFGKDLSELWGEDALADRMRRWVPAAMSETPTPQQLRGLVKVWTWLNVGNFCSFCQFRRRPLGLGDLVSRM